jgi:glycosyltransferase involved in cell wall biosynthesis
MRLWDVRTAHGVDEYVANSRFIARRIAKLYGRSAEVIHPPVAVDTTFRPVEKEDFFLTASRLVPYKNIRAIVEAFALLPKARLVVAGDGPEMGRLKAVAGSNVTFTGFVPDPELRRLMATARAFVFAAEEDFGITPVEAQACGTPVIAWRRGGVRETVVADGEHRTGLFFDEATADGIADAIHRFHRIEDRVRPQDCHRNALRFSEDRFNENFGRFARERFEQFSASMAAATCRSEPVAAPMLAVRELAAERRSSLGAV